MTLFNVEIDFDAKDYVSLSIDGENAHLLDESDIERALLAGSYQDRVAAWVETCFGESSDPRRKTRRAHRFAEEAIEFLQSIGIPKEHVLQLVDYVYSRPEGDPVQELGGVMVTLCGAATAHDLDVNECAEKELARVWTKVDALRSKNATQDKSSPLPGVTPVDPRTGRPIGDHGTALQAMQFATESYIAMSQEREFLKGWVEGNLDEWPEFYEWLKKEESK